MNKFLKIILIVTINIFILVLCLFISDIIIYKHNADIFYKTNSKVYNLSKFTYQLKPKFAFDLNAIFNGTDNVYNGRLPDGTEYYDKIPITIFGCSFAHGQYLDYNQTFSYKLAHSLKRPVYNRAIPGKGLQHMLLQSRSKQFYNDVPPSDTVFYIMIKDHYKRMKVNYLHILDTYQLGNYEKKNNKLAAINYNNPLLNLLRSCYTFKLLKTKYTDAYIHNPKNADKLTDEVLLYFIETRKELEKHWNTKVKFVILGYYHIPYWDLLKSKLEQNDFIVYSINNDITAIDLYNTEGYTISETDKHPNEKAWNLITPLVIEKLNLNK